MKAAIVCTVLCPACGHAMDRDDGTITELFSNVIRCVHSACTEYLIAYEAPVVELVRYAGPSHH